MLCWLSLAQLSPLLLSLNLPRSPSLNLRISYSNGISSVGIQACRVVVSPHSSPMPINRATRNMIYIFLMILDNFYIALSQFYKISSFNVTISMHSHRHEVRGLYSSNKLNCFPPEYVWDEYPSTISILPYT